MFLKSTSSGLILQRILERLISIDEKMNKLENALVFSDNKNDMNSKVLTWLNSTIGKPR